MIPIVFKSETIILRIKVLCQNTILSHSDIVLYENGDLFEESLNLKYLKHDNHHFYTNVYIHVLISISVYPSVPIYDDINVST